MKNMKNILLVTIPLLAFLFVVQTVSPITAHAQTRLTDPSTPNNSTVACYTFTRNLGENRPLNNQEAQALLQDLTAAGFWPFGTTITTYNEQVASAVSGFQQKYASQILTPNGLSYGTGFIGASTRTVLNSLYGCGSTPNNPIVTPITNPNNLHDTRCPDGFVCTPVNTNPQQPITNPVPVQPTNPTPTPTSINSSNPGAGFTPAPGATLTLQYLSNVTDLYTAVSWSKGLFGPDGVSDYVSQATLTLNSSKTISSMLFSTGHPGLASFTSNAVLVDGGYLYPLVVTDSSGRQLDTDYNQILGTYGPGTFTFTTYNEHGVGDMAYENFTLTIYFTDGTYVSATTPGPGASGQSNSNQFNQNHYPILSYPPNPVTNDGQKILPIGQNGTNNVIQPQLDLSPISTITPGSTLVLTGSGFSSPSSVVNFSNQFTIPAVNQDVSPNSLTANTINLIVPSNLSLGQYTVSVVNLVNGQRLSSHPIILTVQSTNPVVNPITPPVPPTVSPTPLCPVGFTCTIAPRPIPSCPVGYTCTINPTPTSPNKLLQSTTQS